MTDLPPPETTEDGLAALGLVSTLCAAVVAYESTRWREQRLRLRHPDVTA